MTDKRAGITSIGGYVGTQEAWEEVAVKWEENLRYWRLDEFHLHDLVEKMGHEKARFVRSTSATLSGTRSCRPWAQL